MINTNLKIISFLHSGDMGDIIAGLGAVKEFCEKENAKARIILDTTGGIFCNDPELNKFIYLSNAKKGLKFNDSNYNFLKPLIESQPYVYSVEKYSNQTDIDYNLNLFRKEFANIQNLLYAHQKTLGLPIGFKGKWLFYPNQTIEDKIEILVSRSSRYQSSHLFFASNEYLLASKGRFIGTDFEYNLFKDCFRFVPVRYDVSNALDCLRAVSNSNTILVNSTLMFWIALGFNHPNIIHEAALGIYSTVFHENETNIKYIFGNKLTISSELKNNS